MRISDRSSDVCSSDLAIWHVDGDPAVGTVGIIRGREAVRGWLKRFPDSFRPLAFSVKRMIGDGADVIALGRFRHRVVPTGAIVDSDYANRSEEHTSELQSLMRHSTAVLRMKTKKQ